MGSFVAEAIETWAPIYGHKEMIIFLYNTQMIAMYTVIYEKLISEQCG